MDSLKSSPILKLHHDILYNIFFVTIDIDYASSPHTFEYATQPILNTVRSYSQVCHLWRDILLRSPVIWAHCIQIHSLCQDNNNWRSLVIQRTGNSLLTVTAFWNKSYQSQSDTFPVDNFLELFNQESDRISRFYVSLNSHTASRFIPSTWHIFGRSWSSLKEFSMFVPPTYGLDRNPPPNFQLFGNNAPSLRLISLSPFCSCPMLLASLRDPSFFASGQIRMIDLQGQERLKLSDSDLRNICKYIPHIETLRLTITSFELDSHSKSKGSTHIPLPHLDEINITSPSFAIYTFLSHVYPRPGCELICQIDQRWSKNEGEPDFPEIIPVIGQYTASAAKRLERQGAVVPRSLNLRLRFDYGVSLYVDGEDFYIMNMTFFLHRAYYFPLDVFALVLDCLSAIKLPDSIKDIAVDTCSDQVYDMLALPAISNFLSHMDHVSDLCVYKNPSILFALDKLAKHDHIVLFPHLKKVTLHETWKPGMMKILSAFFRNRQKLAMPIDALYIDKVSKDLEEGCPLRDWYFLDKVAGLKLVLQNNWQDMVLEYICGGEDPHGNLVITRGDDPDCLDS